MADFVKFNVPKELQEKQFLVIEKVRKNGKIKIGSNEVTKAIERGNAKLVMIAQDVSPPEVVMHLPVLCAEKNIPFTYVSTKKELGERIGLKVGTSSAVVISEGDAKKEIEDLSKKLLELRKTKAE